MGVKAACLASVSCLIHSFPNILPELFGVLLRSYHVITPKASKKVPELYSNSQSVIV